MCAGVEADTAGDLQYVAWCPSTTVFGWLACQKMLEGWLTIQRFLQLSHCLLDCGYKTLVFITTIRIFKVGVKVEIIRKIQI